jgi:hypothetical protein
LIADQLRGVVVHCAVVWEDAVKFIGIGGYLCGQVLCNALVSFAPPFSSWRDGMDKSGGVVSPSTMGRAGIFMRYLRKSQPRYVEPSSVITVIPAKYSLTGEVPRVRPGWLGEIKPQFVVSRFRGSKLIFTYMFLDTCVVYSTANPDVSSSFSAIFGCLVVS